MTNRTPLVLVGMVLIGFGLWNWFAPELRTTVIRENVEPSTVTEAAAPSSVREQTDPTRVIERALKGSGGSDASPVPGLRGAGRLNRTETGASSKITTTTPGEKTTTSNPGTKQTVTESPPNSRRSETVTIALLAFGFLALVAGLSPTGITSFTLPGGAGATFGALKSAEAAEKLDERLTTLEKDVRGTLVPKLELLIELARAQRRRGE